MSALAVLAAWSEQGIEALVVVMSGAGVMLLQAQGSALLLITLELQSYASYMIVALGSGGRYRSAGIGAYFLVGAAATAGIMLGWGCMFRTGELSFPPGPGYESGGMRTQMAGLIVKVGCFPFGL